MSLLLATVFVASLLGSLHCVGMCGPFALLASAAGRSRTPLMPTFAYNLGRMMTYVMVGGLFGTLGMALNRLTGRSAESISIWQQSAAWFAGGLMIVVGLVGILRFYGIRVQLPSIARPLQSLLQSAFKRILKLSPNRRALFIGLLATLMPCGWLYAFAITAAGTGSPVYGMLVMLAFWSGSVPIMAALMLGTNYLAWLGRGFQKQVPLMMSCLVITTGVFTLFYRAPHSMFADPITVTDFDQLQLQVENIDHNSLPCCQTEAGK